MVESKSNGTCPVSHTIALYIHLQVSTSSRIQRLPLIVSPSHSKCRQNVIYPSSVALVAFIILSRFILLIYKATIVSLNAEKENNATTTPLRKRQRYASRCICCIAECREVNRAYAMPLGRGHDERD